MIIRRTTPLPFALPDVGEAELSEIKEVLESGWITTGPKTHLFEREFARYVGAKFAVAVNSCTAAMHLSLEAIGLQAGDFVVTTPYTFAATAEVIRYFNAVPVFVDVERDTLNIDPHGLRETVEDLQRCLQGHKATIPAVARAFDGNRWSSVEGMRDRRRRGALKALIPVHIAGHPCEMDAIAAIAQTHQLAVVEDAAHACSASFRGRPVGSGPSTSVPWAACFSFYATKTLATGEGGMVTTDIEEFADRMRVMSLHGISKDAWKRYTAEGSWHYNVMAAGFKYNMPDILAAVGLAQLRKVDAMRQRREEIARRYNEAFAECPEIERPTVREHVDHAWHLYQLRLNQDSLGIGRDEFILNLRQRNIGSSVHFIPLHVHPYYQATYGYEPEDLPVAFREHQREISLPIYSKMTDFDVESVVDAVVDILREFRAKASYAVARR
ncbi:MAG TPA: DegT/DnrJ/EryC1/StrS family aminotransferase [Vicinamibacterales bacterium]|nr:DegT/DnrJ/EryC1/StrS family aminotransferase [Vicinamibacterales bacterium]